MKRQIAPHPLIGLRVRYLVLIDILCILMALVMSFVIRYEALAHVWPYLTRNWTLFVVAVLVRVPIYYGFGLYHRLWRYASMKELRVIVAAGVVGSALIYIINFWIQPAFGLINAPSRSIWVLEGMLSVGLLAGTRFLLRLLQERMRPKDLARLRTFVQNPSRVLLIGAGDTGAMIVREMQSNPGIGMKPIGFVDDDSSKLNMHIHGVPVLGDRHKIIEIVRKEKVDQMVIAMPTAPGKEIREIVQICEKTGVHLRTIPGVYELLNGTVGLSQLREVEIEDLLRREPVHTNTTAVGALLKGKRVLVTGGGGSIGGELCRQILRHRPAELILVGHGENSIFEAVGELQQMLHREFSTSSNGAGLADPLNEQVGHERPLVRSFIADIRFRDRLRAVFKQARPDIVFHAAAHKHVALMEANPSEAITNNLLGTRNVLEAARAVNVQRFVMISSDKAVNPTSVMGASKRAAELLVRQAAMQSELPYVAVRFGNVLGSRGSVVLTFKQQIAAGGPVTVTHPDMERFFMTIPEAVQLVLQAAELGKGGEVFLLDMGEPIKIVDLARDLIELSGYEEGRDIDIVFTGPQPGEKLYEELVAHGEHHQSTRHEKIFIAGNGENHLPEQLDEAIAALERAAYTDDAEAILRSLQNLIPEYRPITLPSAAQVSSQITSRRQASAKGEWVVNQP